jgi:hypothetical protein
VFNPRFMTSTNGTAASGPIEIFRTGSHTSVDGQKIVVTAADLAEIVESYMPDQPAPLVVGHPALDAPAYGWVSALDVDGDTLRAFPDQVESAFAEAVTAGRYKKVSASLYPRDHPANPTPGKLHLKHVGFLGAAAPAIKGLKTVSFSEGQQAGCITIETPEQEISMADDEHKKALEFAERQKQLDEREANIAKREQDAIKAAANARHADNLSFAEARIAEGKFMPARKDELVHVLDQLSEPKVLSFGEGDKAKSPAAIVRAWFADVKPVISFGELPKDDGAGGDVVRDPVADGKAARALVMKARAEGRTLSFAEAVTEVTKAG